MFVDGEEFEAKQSGTKFTFSNVEIEKSGKIQFKIDLKDDTDAQGKVVKLTPNFNGDAFANARYDNSRDDVNTGDVSGTISFSQVTIQAAKATLKNSLSKAVEYMNNDTNEGVVFDGTYTAKKSDINLNKFYMSGAANPNKVKVTYYLYIEGKEVASVDAYGTGAEEVFDDVLVKAGESVKVRVVAEVEAYGDTATLADRYLVLGGTDNFDKDVDYKAAKVMDMKIVEKGSVNITAGAIAKTVLLKAKNQKIAEFTVKPANGASSVEIETISFALVNSNTSEGINSDDISVMFGNNELEADDTNGFVYSDINETIKDAVVVKVILDEEKAGTLTLNNVKVNTKTLNKDYVSRFENAIVKIVAQNDRGGGTTRFDFDVDSDDDYEVSSLKIALEGNLSGSIAGTVDDSSFVEIINPSDVARNVLSISYLVCPVEAEKSCATDYTLDGDVCKKTSTEENVDECTGEGKSWTQTAAAVAAKWTCTTPAASEVENPTVQENVEQSACPTGSNWAQTAEAIPAKWTCTTVSTQEPTVAGCGESNRVTIERNGDAGYPDFFLVTLKDGSTTYAKAAANK